MSQQEFEQQDAQAMRVANREGKEGERPVCDGKSMDAEQAELRRQILWTAIQVLSCVLVAVLFVAALLDEGVVVHLTNLGVLSCGIVAAILIDRAVRSRGKG